jgi:RNA polymerase sigma-70 factor, ECF subfamily
LSLQISTSDFGAPCTCTISLKTLCDDELVGLVKNGREEAFGELHRRYKRRLLVYAERITRSSEDGEDAVQEAFLKAFLRIGDFAGRSSFSTWLTRILINTCIMQLRKKRGYLYISLDEAPKSGHPWKDTIPDPSIDIEGDYLQKRRLESLSKAISKMNPKLRVIMEAHQAHDCSLAELAERNHISLAAVKSRMLRARALLQNSYCHNPSR